MVRSLSVVAGCVLVAVLSSMSIAAEKEKEAELSNEIAFDKMMQVLTHKRCVNCHPSGNAPKQGEESRIHDFGVSRGSIKCQSCHMEENNPFSGVPGAPHWDLAPASMKWEGLSRREIAESILDTTRNGGRSHEDLLHHLTEHELVLWAWNPGINPNGEEREAVPVPLEEYKKAVKAWFENGAIIPKSEE